MENSRSNETLSWARGELPRLIVLFANLFWTVLCLGGYRPETLVVTASLTTLLVAVHLVLPTEKSRCHPALWIFTLFVIYAAWNAAYVSPVHWLGWRDWLTWMQPLAVFWVVLTSFSSVRARSLSLGLLGILAAVSASLAFYQHFGHGTWLMLGRKQADQFIGRASGPFGIPNSLGALLILILPVSIFLASSADERHFVRVGFGLSAFLSVAGIVFSVSRGAWLGLALALIIWPLLFGQGKLLKRLAIATAVLVAIAAGVALLNECVPLIHARLAFLVRDLGERSRPILWRGAWNIFRARPSFGGGAGSFDVRFEEFRPEGFIDDPQWAHNDYLNTLCDYGLVGFVLAAAGALVCAWKIRGVRGVSAALAIGMIAFGFQLFVDFHFKIPGLGIAFATVAGLVVAEAWPASVSPGSSPRSLATRVVFAAVSIAVFSSIVLPRLRAESLRYHAREAMDRWGAKGESLVTKGPEVEAVQKDLVEACRLDPANALAWSDLSLAESLLAFSRREKTVELGHIAEASARRAISLCSTFPEFWERLCVGLDMQYRWPEGGDASAKALALGPGRPEAWYYRGYHLSLSSPDSDEAIAVLDICLRLDPGYRAALSLRQRLAKRSAKRFSMIKNLLGSLFLACAFCAPLFSSISSR